nr:uncharacterized protein LOC128697679 isoform X1 [Cherax quadricarinatus]
MSHGAATMRVVTVVTVLLLLLLLLLIEYVRSECRSDPGIPKGKFRNVDGCPVTRTFQPVCGTDGCDYVNDSALHCAYEDDIRRGVPEEEAVKVAYAGHCDQNSTVNADGDF